MKEKKKGGNKEEELIFTGSFDIYIDFISTFNQSLTLERITFCGILHEMFFSKHYPIPLSAEMINA
jgi:hypothetical protein